jgi:glycosyltransferase involved in cell wall biosynthesis
VGRLGNEKGLLYLIASLIEVIQIYKDFKLIIIAPKILEHYSTTIQKQIIIIQNQIKDNYLTDNIVWIDQVSSDRELRDWMSVADIGIVPSMSE